MNFKTKLNLIIPILSVCNEKAIIKLNKGDMNKICLDSQIMNLIHYDNPNISNCIYNLENIISKIDELIDYNDICNYNHYNKYSNVNVDRIHLNDIVLDIKKLIIFMTENYNINQSMSMIIERCDKNKKLYFSIIEY